MQLAIQRTISEAVEEYTSKQNNLTNAVKNFEQAGTDLKTACTVAGTWGGGSIDVGSVYERNLQSHLLQSAWRNVYEGLQIARIAPAKDKNLFEQAMAKPPAFTLENIRATFGDYLLNPRENILRGLAEVFANLDPYYKSHEKIKIGVKGMPKRVILPNVGGYNWGRDRLQDLLNALAAFKGKPLLSYGEVSELLKDGDYLRESFGVWLKRFSNGNGHLFFSPESLREINKGLAEYYGEVLADCAEAKPDSRQASTAVSKDLQYYPTPQAVVDSVMDSAYIKQGDLVLEPSCGCGRFMDAIKSKGVEVHGVEFDRGRAEQARAKGHAVSTANFLELEPRPIYDWVVMNPPFYGKHYAKHIEHALKFLREGGKLIAVLPSTARYDHKIIEGRWFDLPFGSFKESGTNINTSVVTIFN